MYRLFAALPIPPNIARDLQPLQKNLTGAAWRPLENFHITLAFYGDVDRALAHELDSELARIEIAPFQLHLEHIGWFGRKAPHTLWAGVRGPDALTQLASHCSRAGKRLGLRIEKRAYTPHVTLAYCHGTTPEALEAYAARHEGFRTALFWGDRYHLYSSHLGKGPSRYVAEADYVLA